MDTEQFYPTPKELLEKIFKDTDWKTVKLYFEPSAGNAISVIILWMWQTNTLTITEALILTALRSMRTEGQL